MRSKPNIELEVSRMPGTRVILVRHGQSTYNAQGIYQGCCDSSVLTDKGHQSAYQTGVALKELTIDAIYTSTLKRAQETANELKAAMSIAAGRLPTLQVDARLREIDIPAWQGLPRQYIREQFAEDYRCWKERPHQFQMKIPQSEWLAQDGTRALATAVKQQCFPVLDLYKQAQQFWQDILPRHVGKTVLVVSHSGTNRALSSTAIGLTPDRYHVLQQSNCGISILNFPASWRVGAGFKPTSTMEALNLTTHIGETLPKPEEGKEGLRLLLVPSDAINWQQTQKLAEFLKAVPIDFSISSDLNSSQETAERILQHHPTTVHLQVLRQDFPQVWQRTIQSRRSRVAFPSEMNSAPLISGLVVACDPIIKSILGQILGMRADDFWRLQLNPGAISVVHYPSAYSPPVLQAMNISDTALSSIVSTGVNHS